MLSSQHRDLPGLSPTCPSLPLSPSSLSACCPAAFIVIRLELEGGRIDHLCPLALLFFIDGNPGAPEREIPLYGRERFFFGAKPDSCIAYLIPLGGIFSQKGSGIVLQVGSQSAFVQVQEPGLFLLTRHTSSSSSVF